MVYRTGTTHEWCLHVCIRMYALWRESIIHAMKWLADIERIEQ
jgi:hypothetical protein